MNINIMDYIVEQALILIPVLYVLGIMLKNTEIVKDWTIPWILLICGVGASIALMGFNTNSIIQGVLVTGATVYTNQLIKQTTVKSKEQDK